MSVHTETTNRDRAQVNVEADPEDEYEVIEDIDVNMNSKGEYVEFMLKWLLQCTVSIKADSDSSQESCVMNSAGNLVNS